MAWFALARILIVAAVAYAAALLRPLPVNLPANIAFAAALAGIVVAARGNTTSVASGANLIASGIGSHQAGKHTRAAAEAGLVVSSPMGLVVTDRRLITLRISTPWGFGLGGSVKGLLSAVALSDVEHVEVKRLAVGKSITLTVRGSDFKLEAGAGADAQGLADTLEQARVAAPAV